MRDEWKMSGWESEGEGAVLFDKCEEFYCILLGKNCLQCNVSFGVQGAKAPWTSEIHCNCLILTIQIVFIGVIVSSAMQTFASAVLLSLIRVFSFLLLFPFRLCGTRDAGAVYEH